MPYRTTRSAFTLIELLVVIAIIAILAAILFPVFAQAREKARQASCLSNEKQIGMGLMMYVQDYDETYPPAYQYKNNNWVAGTNGGASGGYLHFSLWLHPYVKNEQVYVCSSDKTRGLKPDNPPALRGRAKRPAASRRSRAVVYAQRRDHAAQARPADGPNVVSLAAIDSVGRHHRFRRVHQLRVVHLGNLDRPDEQRTAQQVAPPTHAAHDGGRRASTTARAWRT
jgi:prepilin-type N-terminal cleavage/methylation domain-containing protein